MSAQLPDRGLDAIKLELSSAADFTARVWGMAADGRPFTQDAVLDKLSREGALVRGLLREIRVGEIIGVKYRQRKARCQIVWTDGKNGNAEIRLLPDHECPWDHQLDRAGSETAPLNRRKYHRYEIGFLVELWSTDSRVPMRTSANDVSGNGCHVKTLVPPPTGTRLGLTFWIGTEKITGEGRVRTSDTGLGMGVEFTGLDQETKDRLQRWLDESQMSQSSSAAAGSGDQ